MFYYFDEIIGLCDYYMFLVGDFISWFVLNYSEEDFFEYYLVNIEVVIDFNISVI